MMVLGFGALAGIAVFWPRRRQAGGEQAASAGHDLAVAVGPTASWSSIRALYAT
jgi:hypothetical protein